MKKPLSFLILFVLFSTPAFAGKWSSLWRDIKSSYRHTLQMPANMTVEASSASGAVVNFNVTAKDSAGSAVTAVCSPTSGSPFALGSTLVSCVTEGSGSLRASASFSVKVVDTHAPALILPDAISLISADGAPMAAAFNVSAQDLVSGAVNVQCTPASGSLFPVGSHSVSCSTTDAAGNTEQDSFAVVVTQPEDGVVVSDPIVVPDPVVPDPVPVAEQSAVTLSWAAPASREDGSPLTVGDISKYEIYIIGEFTGMDQRIVVDNGSALQHTLENLQNDTYHFFISAMDNNGLLSEPSDVITLTL